MVTFYLSPSKAPNVLNGGQINATKYILMSNTKAPLLEESFPEDKRKVETFLLIFGDTILCHTFVGVGAVV